jgi:hypothetical protein
MLTAVGGGAEIEAKKTVEVEGPNLAPVNPVGARQQEATIR